MEAIREQLKNKYILVIRVFDKEYINIINEIDKLYYVDTIKINKKYVDLVFRLFSIPDIKPGVLVITPNFINEHLSSFIYTLELLKFKHFNNVKFIFLNDNPDVVNLTDCFFTCKVDNIKSKLENIPYYDYNLDVTKLYFEISNTSCIKEYIKVLYRVFKPEYMLFILKELHKSSQITNFNDRFYYSLGDVLEENISIIENTHKKMELCHKLELNKDEAKEFLKLI